MKISRLFYLAMAAGFLLNGATAVRATVTEADQQSLHSQYVGKVLMFRKYARMVSQYDVQEDGTVAGNARPGFWAVDGAAQVKGIEFFKDRVTFKCIKLWADIKGDGKLHFFPASVALKGKDVDYPQTTDIIFRTSRENVAAAEIVGRLSKLCLGEHEPMLGTAPQPIAAFIQNVPATVDISPTGEGFKGTPPKALSYDIPTVSHEAELVGQAGREIFVVYVDEQGKGAVVSFSHLLQYGLEETTIEAVKGWKFEPATQDGKPVAVRMALSIDYKTPGAKK